MAFWLVRHARPLVAPGICYGRLDVPADPADTERAADALAHRLPPDFRLLSSPLQRCLRLAEAVARLRPDLALEVDDRLAEMDFGGWEGRSWSDVGEAALAAWTADFATHAPGGGESVTAFMARVGAAMDASAGPPAVWVTHAGVIRAATLLQRGHARPPSARDWPSSPIAFGSCTELPDAFQRSGAMSMVRPEPDAVSAPSTARRGPTDCST